MIVLSLLNKLSVYSIFTVRRLFEENKFCMCGSICIQNTPTNIDSCHLTGIKKVKIQS